jgi:hypothetical protein
MSLEYWIIRWSLSSGAHSRDPLADDDSRGCGYRFNFQTAIPSSFRGDAKHRTRNLEIPGLVLAHHPGMTFGYNFAISPQVSREFCP